MSSKGVGERCVLEGVSNHIKAFTLQKNRRISCRKPLNLNLSA